VASAGIAHKSHTLNTGPSRPTVVFIFLVFNFLLSYLVFTQEIKTAVKEFSQKLDKSDDMAVLCLLSHGGKGFIYGSDGSKVKVSDVTRYLDNKNCPAMRDKPKQVIIQACQGGRF